MQNVQKTSGWEGMIRLLCYAILTLSPWLAGPIFLDFDTLRPFPEALQRVIKNVLTAGLGLIVIRTCLASIMTLTAGQVPHRPANGETSPRKSPSAWWRTMLLLLSAVLAVLASELMRQVFADYEWVLKLFYCYIGLLSISVIRRAWQLPGFPLLVYVAAQINLALLSFVVLLDYIDPKIILLSLSMAFPSVIPRFISLLADTPQSENHPSLVPQDSLRESVWYRRFRSQRLTDILSRVPVKVLFGRKSLLAVLLLSPPVIVGLCVHLAYLPTYYLTTYGSLAVTLPLISQMRNKDDVSVSRLSTRILIATAVFPLITFVLRGFFLF